MKGRNNITQTFITFGIYEQNNLREKKYVDSYIFIAMLKQPIHINCKVSVPYMVEY